MNAKDVIFYTVGGLGLFLVGMGLLSEGIKKAAGQRLRKLLTMLTRNRIAAVLLGVVITGIIQSSSATTVMLVGFVNAGLLPLKQALCVVMGANIGTTVTAWLVSGFAVLNITEYALLAIAAGFVLQTAAKRQQMRNVGQVVLGFGLLFVGIGFMQDAFSPLKDNLAVQQALVRLGHNPLLGVLTGTAMTMVLQSSSATIAMLQILAYNGVFGTNWDAVLRIVIPIVLGDNIGTTITAQIAALRTSRSAKRVAWGHTLFNTIGVAYMLPLVWAGLFVRVVEWIAPVRLSQGTIMLHIAVAHTTFNVFNTLVFLPLVSWLEAAVRAIVPVKAEEMRARPLVLEEHLLDTPEIAVDQARREIVRMTQTARDAVNYAVDGLVEDDRRKLVLANQTEEATDSFQYEITAYLAALSTKQLSDKISVELPVLMHTVNDLERIGDHAVNITEIAERKIGQKLAFSDSAGQEVGRLRTEVNQMFDRIVTALENNDTNAATLALSNEETLNRMQLDFRRNHVQRMTDGICNVQTGLIFIDLVDNMEKIGDHLSNIAHSVIGGLQWDGSEAKKVTVKINPSD
jgi:phosphate:Na+ symporter